MDVRFKPLYTPLAWVSEPWEAQRDRAGAHCEQVQQALVEAGKLDLVHVQKQDVRSASVILQSPTTRGKLMPPF